jgi:hypothetical protein
MKPFQAVRLSLGISALERVIRRGEGASARYRFELSGAGSSISGGRRRCCSRRTFGRRYSQSWG